jgi:hypothetical protein
MTYMVNSGRNDRDETQSCRHHGGATGFALLAGAASAQEIRFMCYSDGNECEVYDDVLTASRPRTKAST